MRASEVDTILSFLERRKHGKFATQVRILAGLLNKMRWFFSFRYPKLAILALMIIVAYFVFSNDYVRGIVDGLNGLTYLGIFIAGVFFSFGFSTPFAIGFFVTSSPESIFLASIVGGIGAMFSDLFIFHFVRFSLMDEFNRLENTAVIKSARNEMKRDFRKKIRNYILYFFAGIIIASPLPDEIGVSMLAGLSDVKANILMMISFAMNAFGIFIMLLIGSAI